MQGVGNDWSLCEDNCLEQKSRGEEVSLDLARRLGDVRSLGVRFNGLAGITKYLAKQMSLSKFLKWDAVS